MKYYFENKIDLNKLSILLNSTGLEWNIDTENWFKDEPFQNEGNFVYVNTEKYANEVKEIVEKDLTKIFNILEGKINERF